MAPESPSPSPSSTLLPFISGGQPRRGSLASINSKRTIDKDVLAQTLDDIHTSASRSDALTSFHDYDGGDRGSSKELVSNGVSGLYRRFKESMGGTPSKEGRRPKSSGSVETDSPASFSPSGSRLSMSTAGGARRKVPGDAASVSTASIAESPLVASFSAAGEKTDPPSQAGARRMAASSRASEEITSADATRPRRSHQDTSGSMTPEQATSRHDLDKARAALEEEDGSESATEALARVLSQSQIQLDRSGKPKPRQLLSRSHTINAIERGPFYQEATADSQEQAALPAFHNDNIIDPDLAPFLSDDDSEGEEQPSIFATMAADGGQAASPAEREKMGIGSLLASAMKKGRSRLGDKSATASSMRGITEDTALGASTKHLPKLHRKRNPSIGSLTVGRPSPRRSKSNMLLKTIETDVTGQTPPSPLGQPISPLGTKVIRSSAMHGADAPPVELNQASLEHVRKLLAQLLHDANIDATAAWEKALIPVLLQCTDDVEPDVQRGDDMDIRHYVKLKKVPGGRPGDTSYVSGVVFSKNVALKSMARSLHRPRIAIVTFAIEYARHQAHFMSLEPVIAQEREYLNNLVGRIAALKPHVLLVQRNVSGLALTLLEKAGITVAYNIKESVLAAVARVTQTPLIKSVDKLAIDPSHLGTCENFDVKTYLHQGMRRTYVYVSGCQADLGCTIVLRGGDTKTLRKIKRVTEFMCYVVYNLKLETSLMRDEFISMPSSLETYDARIGGRTGEDVRSRKGLPGANGRQETDVLHGAVDGQPYAEDELPSRYAAVEEESRSRILSASPFVQYMQPYLLTQLREQETKLATYKRLRDQYAAADDAGNNDEKPLDHDFELVKPEMVNTPASKDQPKAVREFLHAVHSAEFERTMHSYETQKRLWESFIAGNNNPFDPFSHQTIVVLHSTVSSITSAPCVGPELLGIGFYAGYNHVEPDFEEDCTLGQYVEDLCMGANSTCKECNRKMHDHHRQYVHGYGQLSVSVQRQQARMRGYSNTILMWSSCRICHAETTILPMSDNTWKYSFAKYLELSFWSEPLRPRAGVCGHNIYKDFLRCFGFQDLVVMVQYEPVEIYNVIVPRQTVTWKVEADLVVKNDQYTQFATRLTAFTDSIKKRLSSINVDTLDEKKLLEAQEALDNLRKRADDDHVELLHKLRAKYASSRYYEQIPLNRALRFMDEKAIAWDEAFSNFERDYFPSETDIRKLATLQLKKMFLDSTPSSGDGFASEGSDGDGEEKDEFGEEIGGVEKARAGNGDGGNVRGEKEGLAEVVQEHRKSWDGGGEGEGRKKSEHSEAGLDEGLARKISPQQQQGQDQSEAVERDEVKHLDLAIASGSPGYNMLDEVMGTSADSKHSTRPGTAECPVEEPFAIQPKPLSSGLLERIEQIRNTKGSEPETVPESRIPRPAKKQETPTKSVPPPLMRAQSQPSHVPRQRRADAAVDQPAIDEVPTPSQTPEHNRHEKRLSERLGLSHLPSKVGKLTPSMIPRSIPTRVDASNNTSVSALAKHFEQMSREFEKERLRERRQRASKSRQARANPLASSRPVVEVYRNATDAVGARELESAGLEAPTSDERVERADKAEPPLPVSSDEVVAESPQAKAVKEAARQRENAGSDTEGDSDVERLTVGSKTRTRDHSDPVSGTSSTTLMSPTHPAEMELHPELSIPEHKKNVWFKVLADFWSKRSASGWAPLEYPLHSHEHVFEDSDIIVREDEPSSVIALCLSSSDYLTKVREFRSHPNKHTRTKSANGNHAAPTTTFAEGEQQKAIEASLLSDTGTHMKYSFAHGQVKATCKIFYAESFDALRRRCGVADRFVESLSRCLKWDSKGGKTKSIFLRTLDNRFVIKSLQEVELKAFTKFAPDYFAFMSYTLFHGVPSVIAKMFGLFQVIIKNPVTGVDFSYYLLVMENLFYERNPHRRFDLKGSMRNRKIESTGQPDEVLLDENLVETIFESPLFVREHARKLLQASVWNDTLFLSKQNVMDYSLMAGFDDDRKELVVGIIDCIRTYTWDKKLESWIKDRGKNKPTITSPRDYRNRFRFSIMQYALVSPSAWHEFQAQMAPPRTLGEEEAGMGRAGGG
ncbi:hypothetical protein MBLNU230_g0683t1 [Neophaeotheca triangularis]